MMAWERSAASSRSGSSGVMMGLIRRPASITKPADLWRRLGSRLNQYPGMVVPHSRHRRRRLMGIGSTLRISGARAAARPA
jgi:hypothetical protein